VSALILAALGVAGGAALIAVAALVPARLLARPEPDPLPPEDPSSIEEAGA